MRGIRWDDFCRYGHRTSHGSWNIMTCDILVGGKRNHGLLNDFPIIFILGMSSSQPLLKLGHFSDVLGGEKPQTKMRFARSRKGLSIGA